MYWTTRVRTSQVMSHVVFYVMFFFSFHKQISEKTGATVEEQSEAVQEFYTVSGGPF